MFQIPEYNVLCCVLVYDGANVKLLINYMI
uniref:Uncharacterized protein n=1 Tax=Anguilla anguilla TaxID=7936 RepID=A0A0E9XNW8_ANGAN